MSVKKVFLNTLKSVTDKKVFVDTLKFVTDMELKNSLSTILMLQDFYKKNSMIDEIDFLDLFFMLSIMDLYISNT